MSAFLYYFPGHGSKKSQLTRADVQKTWVAESLWDVILDNRRWGQHTVTAVMYHGGPDRGVGTMLACTLDNEEILDFKICYTPKAQTWIRVGEKKVGEEFDALEKKTDGVDREQYINDRCVWLGWYNDSVLKPNPVALCRLWPVEGESVLLCDGNEWKAPIIRMQPRKSVNALNLPKTFNLGEDDLLTADIKPEFAEFGNLADRIWDHYWGVDGREMSSVEVFKAAVKLIGLNYRISRVEANALNLLDDDSISKILSVSNNFRLVKEMLAEAEKKAPNPSDS